MYQITDLKNILNFLVYPQEGIMKSDDEGSTGTPLATGPIKGPGPGTIKVLSS